MPMRTWSFTRLYSSSVSGPALCSSASGMPIFPTSWSWPERRRSSTASSGSPMADAIAALMAATRCECPRRNGSLASCALTSARTMEIEISASCAVRAQLLRAQRDFLANHPLDVAPLDLELALAQRALDGLGEVVQLDRLHQVVHRPVRERLGGGRRVVHRGEHEHGEVRAELHRARHDLRAGHPRHAHVAEQRVETAHAAESRARRSRSRRPRRRSRAP